MIALRKKTRSGASLPAPPAAQGKTVPSARALSDAEAGTTVRIVAIGGGASVRQRLFALGFHVGDRVAVDCCAPFRGPVLVNNLTTGTRLGVGRGVARKILVEKDDVG